MPFREDDCVVETLIDCVLEDEGLWLELVVREGLCVGDEVRHCVELAVALWLRLRA